MLRKKLVQVVAVPALLLSLFFVNCGSSSGTDADGNSALSGLPSDGSGGNGDSSGVTITNTFSLPKELSKGDLLYANLSNGSSLDFSGVDPNAEFILTVANTSVTQGSLTVQLSGNLSAELDIAKSMDIGGDEETPAEDLEEGKNVTELFHEVLRIREKDSSGLEIPQQQEENAYSLSKSMSKDVSASVAVGDKRSFKVLASLTSSTSYVTVNGIAECIGSRVVFYVDERIGSDILSDKDISGICSQFDATAIKEEALFGSASNVDGDGKIAVIFTPQVNKLGALGGGIITGFFNSIDLYPSSTSNPASNYTEVLYILVPDPSGAYGTPISKSFAMSNLIPAVLPHEFQHAISYNQHVFANKGSAEESWLNEGMSHLAEDLFGQNQENPSRYGIFLGSPSSYSLVAGSYPGLAARGAAYLFLRFLYEQSEDGNKFVKSLDQTNLTGTKNIETAFAGRASDFDQFGEFFLRWSIALGITDAGVSQDRRYTYKPRFQDATTGNWSGVCLRCNAQDNRGTVLSGPSIKTFGGSSSGTAQQSSAQFYKVAGIKGKLAVGSNSSGNGYGVLIRTK